MTYVEILRERIAAGELSFTDAMIWLLSYGMMAHMASKMLRGEQ